MNTELFYKFIYGFLAILTIIELTKFIICVDDRYKHIKKKKGEIKDEANNNH